MPTPGPQFQQLAMFHTADELRDPAKTTHPDKMPGQSVDQLFRDKLGEAQEKGLDKSIKQNGVRTPVDVYHGGRSSKPMLSNGHHRVAVVHAQDRNALVPVQHSSLEQKVYENNVNTARRDAFGDRPSRLTTRGGW